jgi:hypothetical protein
LREPQKIAVIELFVMRRKGMMHEMASEMHAAACSSKRALDIIIASMKWRL